MKRRYPALVERKLLYSPPRVSVFPDINLIIDAYAMHSLLEVTSGRIEAGLRCASRPAISGGAKYSTGYSGDVGSTGRPRLEHRVSTTKSLDPPEEINGGRRVD
jgi:hypothetical protein